MKLVRSLVVFVGFLASSRSSPIVSQIKEGDSCGQYRCPLVCPNKNASLVEEQDNEIGDCFEGHQWWHMDLLYCSDIEKFTCTSHDQCPKDLKCCNFLDFQICKPEVMFQENEIFIDGSGDVASGRGYGEDDDGELIEKIYNLMLEQSMNVSFDADKEIELAEILRQLEDNLDRAEFDFGSGRFDLDLASGNGDDDGASGSGSGEIDHLDDNPENAESIQRVDEDYYFEEEKEIPTEPPTATIQLTTTSITRMNYDDEYEDEDNFSGSGSGYSDFDYYDNLYDYSPLKENGNWHDGRFHEKGELDKNYSTIF